MAKQRLTFFGFPLAEISKKTGLPTTTIWRHLNGKRKISAEFAKKYAHGCGIPLSSLRPDLWPPESVSEANLPASIINKE